MVVSTIRNSIANARNHELHTGQLANRLQQRIDHLHPSIQLPPGDSIPALLNFIIRYIEHVPEFIEAVDQFAREFGIEEYTDPIKAIAAAYFDCPPALLEDHQGLDALMDEAYLAHRLIEEVNDQFISHCQVPLIPMDMTRSNLIIHHLVGEPFANELDEAVHLVVKQLTERLQPFTRPGLSEMSEKARRLWSNGLTRWPCLTDSLSINLLFDVQSARIVLH